MTERTLDMLRQAVEEDMPAKVQLVYVDYRDQLMPEQVAALVRGDTDAMYESVDEWASEAEWIGACDCVDDLARDVLNRWAREDGVDYDDMLDEWQSSDERMSAIDTARERDESDYLKELAGHTGDVLCRVTLDAMSEDAGLSFREVSVDEFLSLLGFADTPGNRALAAQVIDNASPEFSVAIGSLVFAVDVSDLYSLPLDGKIEIRNPHVWLGNPFAGSGYCDGPFEGTVRIDRSELRTDKDAFGYGWEEVAGCYVSPYKADVVAVTEESE